MTTQPIHTLKEVALAPMAPMILPTVIEQTALSVFESFSARLKESLGGRQERALKLALEGHVAHKSSRIFSVCSEDGKHSYLVNLDKNFCTCPDSQKGSVCKHRLAAYLIEQATQATKAVSDAPLQPDCLAPLDSDEEAIEKARLVLNARSQHLREAVIYAVLEVDGELMQVELLSLEGEVALVRALPKLKDGQLVPQFPFPERKSCTQVIAKCLSEVKIYR